MADAGSVWTHKWGGYAQTGNFDGLCKQQWDPQMMITSKKGNSDG